MTGKRVLVCGGRDYCDVRYLYGFLDAYDEGHGIGVIIHGAYRGADRIAGTWARDRGIECDAYPADWSIGLRAGPERNKRMLYEGQPDVVIAFPGVRGTAHMVSIARCAGVHVIEVKSM